MKILKFFVFAISFMLMSCSDNEKAITKIDNPELVTVAFFDALYNEKNVKKAALVCSPQLSRIILHYRSAKAVGRHMFNMSYDKVTISPDSSGVKVREQFKDSAIITVYFEGYYQDELIKDVKRVSLIQQNGKWIINKLLKDPF
jgi:hypothetical protein